MYRGDEATPGSTLDGGDKFALECGIAEQLRVNIKRSQRLLVKSYQSLRTVDRGDDQVAAGDRRGRIERRRLLPHGRRVRPIVLEKTVDLAQNLLVVAGGVGLRIT